MLSQAVKDELKNIVGEGRYFDNPEDLLLYSYDAFMVQGLPEAALLPVHTEEVSRIMKVAFRERIPVTARGAGTNLAGGSVPTRGGIALVFTKMNKILEISKENRIAVVHPGMHIKRISQSLPSSPRRSGWLVRRAETMCRRFPAGG